MAASANRTSDRTRSNTRNSFLASPTRFQRVKKEPGSKKLVLGQWVEVLAGDEDAQKSPGRLSGGGESSTGAA